jgi:hypothetical protein
LAGAVSNSADVLRSRRFSHSVVARVSGPALCDGQVGIDRRDRRHRQRVEDPAVGQQSAVEHVRRDDAGDGDRGPDGGIDGTALQPHRLAGDQVGRHGRVRDRQAVDGGLAEHVADRVEDLLGAAPRLP